MTSQYYYGSQQDNRGSMCDCCKPEDITNLCNVDATTNGSTTIDSGQFTFSRSLLSTGGWSFGINFLAGNEVNSILGPGFNFTQYSHLRQEANGDILFMSSQNIHNRFVYDSQTATWSSRDNNTRAVLSRIEVEGIERFVIRASNGNISTFHGFVDTETPGRLISIVTRHGDSTTFAWANASGLHQLEGVTDSFGRTVTYRYFGSEHANQLREIEDFLGRKLNFQYDSAHRLVAVVTPSITKGPRNHSFPGGSAYVFQYDASNPRPERQNDLIRIWFPNQTLPFIDTSARTVDVDQVYADAQPRYFVEYGQDPTDQDFYGRVVRETIGNPNPGPGGTWSFLYSSDLTAMIPNEIDPADAITHRTVVTDPNGNQSIHDFNDTRMTVRLETIATRNKLSVPALGLAASYVTWTKYNSHNQPVLVIFPEGNSVENVYDDGSVDEDGTINARRIGLLRSTTRRPDNDLGLNNPTRTGSNGQEALTQRFFYDPIFNQQCAAIDARGNSIDGSTYFTPQNGGDTPTDADRSRYAAISYLDYQKNQSFTVADDAGLQALLDLTSDQILTLIDHVNDEMQATDGTGGLPAGFEMNLGDINGDGTGDGALSGLPAAAMLGNTVKVKHPSVRQLVVNPDYPGSGDPWQWAPQERAELFTANARGQTTTHTDPEGNLAVYVRYPENDPEGDGRFVSATLSSKQYGRLKEVHADADPDDVMTLVGADGDLADFVSGKIERTNTPGVYQDLVTRYQGQAGAGGCSTCGYDSLGNVLSQTDPRGFTTTFDRDELGRVFRTTAPAPYKYRTETYYDANGNVTRADIEDKVVQYMTDDPASANYAKFLPTGSGYVAHVPSVAGPGGLIRRGWFTNLYSFNLLDQKVQDDIDATGSEPSRLVTTYEFDPNGNLIKLTKPEGNIVEMDYDERNLPIARRVGYQAGSEDGAVTISIYDRNGGLIDAIGAVDRLGGAGATTLTAVLEDAFHTGGPITHCGTWEAENTYDGFGRVTQSKDAIGGVVEMTYDPTGQAVATTQKGSVSGSFGDRDGNHNVTLASGTARFDEAGRAYESQQDVFLNTGFEMIAPAVEPPVPGVATPTHDLPSGRSVTHTDGGLAFNSTANDHTATVTLTTGGQSYVLSRTVFDRSGRAIVSASDNGALTSLEYDGAGRQIKMTDPIGNFVETTYDAAGQAVRTRRTEVCTIADAPAGLVNETFESFACYDALGRLVVAGSQGADGTMCTTISPWPSSTQTLLTRVGYDSRNNRTVAIDAKGNTAVTVFDAAGRATESVQHLRQDGAGGPPADGGTFQADGGASIRTVSIFDANGRVVELIDDRGGTTLFAYDSLDRQVSMTFHDGSTRTTSYNAASDVTDYVDENGSVLALTYDALGRKMALSIDRATGVVGTTSQAFEYDGLGRTVYTSDDYSTGPMNMSTTRAKFRFDSLGRIVEEKQLFPDNVGFVTNSAFISFATSGFMLPNDRTLTYDTNSMYRRTEVREGVNAIASWSFFGPARVAEVQLGNGLVLTHMNNARTRSAVQDGVTNPAWGDSSSDRLGYDGAGRMISKRFLDADLNPTTKAYADTASLLGFTTAFDKASNKLYERHLHAENRSHQYPQQDSLGRLLEVQRGTLAQDAYGNVTVTSPITLPGTDTDRTYTLDGLGNWRRTAHTPVGGAGTEEVRQHNLLNQLTRFGTTPVEYDHGDNTGDDAARGNGNIANDGTRRYVYDAFNRLKEVYKETAGQPGQFTTQIAAYKYDALGRRARKDIINGGLSGNIPDGITNYIYSGIQCIEERDGSLNLLRQYIWGLYVDELVQQKELTGETPPTYYPLADLLYRTHALTDESGAIVEAYDYDAYGNTAIFSDDGADNAWFTADDTPADPLAPRCRYLFTGREYDSETGVYWYRARYYHPEMGRFCSRDQLLHSGNLFSLSKPQANTDPLGLSSTLSPSQEPPPPTLPIPVEHHNPPLIRLDDVLPPTILWSDLPSIPTNSPITIIEDVTKGPADEPPWKCPIQKGKMCKWRGTISGNTYQTLMSWGATVTVAAFGTDGKYNYSVWAEGTRLTFSGEGLTVGYLTLSAEFEDLEAPCQWPVKAGDLGELTVIGIGGSAYVPISVSQTSGRVGALYGSSWFSTGGFHAFVGAARLQAELDDVRYVGPTPVDNTVPCGIY